ncbi:hypothetical protein CH330_09730 [candidate division WOR-3 bacterium JGI_Cruoil_03_51_56]|mgnify:CR=1 FL=1|uniref:Transcriptional repressor n=1 Tax=candidate division WOR-3 bacterium JGI_Cruoil_03_51_56 TaxID=1973747 RepID=A0A235BP45_UNCW3|nr:MAG: hypothetical protein CH330_09730 [candidate division WOR-3 bacterium JGI_Cruoil_03_51_56]
MTTNYVETALRKNGFKVTPKRKAIAQLLLSSNKALTPTQVWRKLRPTMGKLGLPSVYRILEELTVAGLLTRIDLFDRILRYAASCAKPGQHHHLVCVKCGRVDIIDCCFQKKEASRIEQQTGFKITSHSMQVQGLCPNCLAKAERQKCSEQS